MWKTENEKVLWIDFARFLSILAVLIDHTKGILYESEAVQSAFFYSVAAFFFLAGMTSFYSLRRRKAEESVVGWTVRRLWRIIAPYLVAVAICQYVRGGFSWSFYAFILWVLNFRLEGQFYFVLIYLQLVVLSPFLYLVTVYVGKRRAHWFWRALYLAAVGGISVFCVEDTFIMDTYGGGRYLFGGTYLFLFVMGMAAAQLEIELKGKKEALIALCISLASLGASLTFLLKDGFALDEAFFGWKLRVNPPGITLTVYSLTVLALAFALCGLVLFIKNRPLERLFRAAAWLGKYTLYVFLYHMIILEGLLPRLPLPADLPRGILAVIYMTAMVGIPVAGKVLYDRIRRALMAGFAPKRPLSSP